MVTAITLLQVRRDKINETAQNLLDIPGVSEVYSVAGEWDLVTVLRCRDNEHLADVVTNHMLKHEPITKSETLIGFRAYSRYDLDAMFDLGLEDGG
ncbi:MAG: Lrp/AsnC family transcriptional regulator [Phycisphaeraceae bacterium]